MSRREGSTMDDWKIEPARDLEQSGMARYRNPRREHGFVSSLLRLGWWSGVRLWLTMVHRLRAHGKQFVPASGPVVLVANHFSHFDALVIASVLPLDQRDRIHPLAAGDVFFETPAVAAFAAHLLNALPVWRRSAGKHGLVDLRRRLLEEEAMYILFPEGGRSRDGQMRPFKPGVGMLVAGTAVPVVPCHLQGTLEAFPPGTRLPRPNRITLRIGKPLTFADVPNDRAGWDHIATTLEAEVRRLGAGRPL
jgi:1-acyl-sn-glycerol-3-phosphate acyltransferase